MSDEATLVSHGCDLHVDGAAAGRLAALLSEALGVGGPLPAVPFIFAMRLAADAVASAAWADDTGDGRILLHESQTIRSFRPLAAGETLSAVLEGRRQAPTSGLVMTAADGAGLPVIEATTRLRHGTAAMLLAARSGMKSPARANAEAFSIQSRPLTASIVDAYAETSGDANPLHTDEILVRSLGLPARIVHGMLIAGLAEPALLAAGMAGRLSELRVRFIAPVYVGENVRLTITRQPSTETARKARIVVSIDEGPVACIADALVEA
ncbi:MAG: MaoC/PaaZ C-terminal domain-containing protein [Mesorhizobium sp.]|nr:MaoC/PaaZ C-terminal domain-containing protein [Mesorhizobium sp.]